jgi:hypothetical protein
LPFAAAAALRLYEHAFHHVVVFVFDDVAVVHVLLRRELIANERGGRRREPGADDRDLPRVGLHRVLQSRLFRRRGQRLSFRELALIYKSLQAAKTLGALPPQDELLNDTIQLVEQALNRAV